MCLLSVLVPVERDATNQFSNLMKSVAVESSTMSHKYSSAVVMKFRELIFLHFEFLLGFFALSLVCSTSLISPCSMRKTDFSTNWKWMVHGKHDIPNREKHSTRIYKWFLWYFWFSSNTDSNWKNIVVRVECFNRLLSVECVILVRHQNITDFHTHIHT